MHTHLLFFCFSIFSTFYFYNFFGAGLDPASPVSKLKKRSGHWSKPVTRMAGVRNYNSLATVASEF
jgi:hypothetical protein